MKKFVLAIIILMNLIPIIGAYPNGISQPLPFNPFTGKLDFVGPGNGLTSGSTYYLFQDSIGSNSYYTFDGSSFCLYVNDIQQICYVTSDFLLEDGTRLLLEDGSKLKLE